MARFEPEGFVLTLDPTRLTALLRDLQSGDPDPEAGDLPVDEDSPTVRLTASGELV